MTQNTQNTQNTQIEKDELIDILENSDDLFVLIDLIESIYETNPELDAIEHLKYNICIDNDIRNNLIDYCIKHKTSQDLTYV